MVGFLDRVGSGVRRIIQRWEGLQVELHGSYSIERFNSMQKYCNSTSVWRAYIVLVSTPLIPLVCVAIIDALPMKSPDLGLAHSGTTWARGILVGLSDSFALSWLFCLYIPDLQISRHTLLFAVVAAVAVSHTALLCVILLLWYPLPFTLLWMCGPWVGTLALSLKVARGEFLLKNPAVQQEVRRFSTILLMLVGSSLVVTGFNVIFQSVPKGWQTSVALLVQLFKITERNLFCRYLVGKDDLKPEMVVFTVEVTNALFLSTSMQQAASANTSTTIILVDFVQILVSLFDLKLMLKSVKDIADKLGINTNKIIATASTIATKYPELAQQTMLPESSFHTKSDVFRLSTFQKVQINTFQAGRKLSGTTQVAPTPANINTEIVPSPSRALPIGRNDVGPAPEDLALIDRLTHRERHLLLRKALQILFLTEFLLLNEFMEVLTPVMYSCYLAIIFHWPNREYYPVFTGFDEAEFQRIVRNIMLYGSQEVISFALLVVVIYKTTHRFPFQQLAHVMTSSWGKIQCKLVIWLVLLLQATIPQLGTAFTGTFKPGKTHKQ